MCGNDIKFKDVCRHTLFVCNCVLFSSGCALLGIGIYLMFNLISFGDYLEEFDPQSALDAYDQNSAVILLGLGGVIMGISFLGCCGAMKENVCLLYTYGTLIILTVLSEIGTTIAIFVFGKKFAESLSLGMLESMEYYNPKYNQTTDVSVITASWNDLQTSMKCCGVNKYSDWSINSSLNMTYSLPSSCCKELSKDCGSGKLRDGNSSDIYMNGCLVNFFDVVNENKNGIMIAFSVIFVAQSIVSIMAYYLGYNLKKRKYDIVIEQERTEYTEEEQ